MKLKASNPFVVWAAFGGLDRSRFTLCELFWACVLRAPIKFAIYVFVGVFVGASVVAMPIVGFVILANGGEFEFGLFVVWLAVLAVLAIAAVIAGVCEIWARYIRGTKPNEIVAEAYRGWKENYCPMVEVERGTEP